VARINEFTPYRDIYNNDAVDSYYELFKNGDRVYTSLNGVTQYYSVDSTSDGTMYMAALTGNEKQLRIYKKQQREDKSYNFRAEDDEEQIIEYESYWQDIGVNILDERSYLYKFLSDREINSVYIKWSGKVLYMLHIFISVDDILLMYKCPPAIMRENDTEKGEMENYQEIINIIKPLIIIGPSDEYNNINDYNIYVKDKFDPQTVAVEWSKNGECLVFYQKENNIKCVKSKDDKEWVIDDNI